MTLLKSLAHRLITVYFGSVPGVPRVSVNESPFFREKINNKHRRSDKTASFYKFEVSYGWCVRLIEFRDKNRLKFCNKSLLDCLDCALPTVCLVRAVVIRSRCVLIIRFCKEKLNKKPRAICLWFLSQLNLIYSETIYFKQFVNIAWRWVSWNLKKRWFIFYFSLISEYDQSHTPKVSET